MVMNYFEAILDWCKVKIPLADKKPKFLFKEGEIWWCHIGLNVGVEIYGKSQQFVRPVIIFRKFNADSFLGIPLTSKIKEGEWYIPVIRSGKRTTAILSQIRTLDSKRLVRRMMAMGDDEFANIKNAFRDAYCPENTHPAPCGAGLGGKSQ